MGLILTLETQVSMEKPGAGIESVELGLPGWRVHGASPRTLSLKVLLALTAAVLLAHVLLLQAPMSAALNPDPIAPAPMGVFSTRAVALVTAARPTAAVKPPATPPLAPSPPAAMLSTSAATITPAPPVTAPAPEQPSPESASADSLEPQPEPALEVAPRPLRESAAVLAAYALPGSVRLKYQVTSNKFPFSLNSELLWQQDGENFAARLEFSAFGLSRVQTSRGQITQQGLAPLRFSDKYRSEVAAHFVRDKGKVTFSANTPDAPLLAGAQDRLSILLQLAGMIAGAPEQFPSATTITIQTIGPRDADTWLFTVGDTETLSLPGGQQGALKLVRNPRQPFDQKVELWLAPALGYLPVRLRITDPNGDHVDQQWLASVSPP